MSGLTQSKIKKIDESYGIIARWLFYILVYPVCFLGFFSGKAYLNENYVSKTYYNESVSKSSTERKEATLEEKVEFKEIKGKLDVLLEQNASHNQKFSDTERRLENIEKRADWLSEKR